MLKNGNHKLGKDIFNFNLPRTTCTHQTELCKKYCYARYGSFGFKNVRDCMDKNLTESQQPDFVAQMNTQLKGLPYVKYVRLHASGDYYDSVYYNKWNDIAKANPQITFLSYTRNADIDFSGRAKNLVVYQSVDKTTKSINPTLPLRSYIFMEGEQKNEHMSYNADKDYFVCNSKCHSCKFCFAGKCNVGFQLRR
jgi:hypothetical protein